MSAPIVLWSMLVGITHAATAPDTSLDTIPAAYFGGHHSMCNYSTGCRSPTNIQMLAKMKLIMVEKWEGHCYDGCMYNASRKPSLPCYPSCDVEGDMVNTLAQVKKENPNVTTGFYLNTLMAFPFYALSGKFADADTLLMDMYTHKPVLLTNDEDMQNIWVYDWGNPKGRALFATYIEGLLSTGNVDGLFADKWGYKCSKVNETTWKICNNRCGYVTPTQAAAYNTGTVIMQEQISGLLKVNSTTAADFGGFLYADGLSTGIKCPKATYPDGSVKINLVGRWALWRDGACNPSKPSGCDGEKGSKNALETIARVKMYLQDCKYKYVFIGCGDHSNYAHWHNQTADPDDVMTDCSPNHIALFLLLVEPGVYIGANGWDAVYEKKLGNPLGPLSNMTDGNGKVVGLTRAFESGTNVTWDIAAGTGIIRWGDDD